MNRFTQWLLWHGPREIEAAILDAIIVICTIGTIAWLLIR